ncbi:MAG: PorP/SprF family type IX secretion system membrane protein, partial [Bacteroidales bacterium]|nr:PorP/SprF family type IX secretion system membrane protein [Bacteroidales bacterium]
MLKRLTLGLLILFSGWNLFGQDPSFSQFYANPMYLNPAFAGSTYCGRLILNFRDQWPSISNGYVTYSASYDQSLEKISSGYGIMFMGDRQGDGALSTMMISGLYSYKLKVTESLNVDFGVQATYNQMKMDWDKFVFGDMIDPNNGSSTLPTHENSANWNTSINYIDFSFGFLAGYEDKLFGGVAVQHINEPDNG